MRRWGCAFIFVCSVASGTWGSAAASAQQQAAAPPAPADDSLDGQLARLLADGRAAPQSTLDLALRAVRDHEQAPADELALAKALDALGGTHLVRGEYDAAIPAYQRALAIKQRLLPADAPAIADTTDGLADALIRLERFDAAARELQQSMSIREQHAAEAPLPLSDTWTIEAALRRSQGNLAAARQLLADALEVRQRLTPNDPSTAALLQLTGQVVFLQGDLTSAARYFADALALAERVLRPQHPSLSLYLRRLALTDVAFGDLAHATMLRERALSIAEASAAPCDLELPSALNAVAISAMQAGDYRRARALYERALDIFQGCLPPTHSLVATQAFNLAELAGMMGDNAEFERQARRAVDLWTKGLGPTHPFVAKANDMLARALAAEGKTTDARLLLERTLATRRRTLGPGHPDVAETLQNLARTVDTLGQSTLALRYLDQAEAIYVKAGAADDPDPRERLLELRGQIYRKRGELTAAQRSFADALKFRDARFGPAHPTAAATRASLALVDFDLGSYGPALDASLAAEEAGRNLLRSTIRSLPERASLAFADRRPSGLATALAIAARDASAAPRVYDALIRSRGVVLEELAARAHGIASLDRAHDPRLAAAIDARQRYANLLVSSFESPGAVPAERLDAARREQETTERALAEQDEGTRLDRARANVGGSEVQAALPAGAVLVSFSRYQRLGARAAYIAFIQPAAGHPAVVPLGDAALIDAAIDRWRAAASSASSSVDYRDAGSRLRSRLWDPIAPHLGGASRIFIVPDGKVGLVTFAALPSGGGRYLIEDAPPIHYAATERDLVTVDAPPSGHGLLALGGAAFDNLPPRRPAATTGRRQFACDPAGGLRFLPLPATAREVEDVARLWPKAQTLLTGPAAGERAFKQAAAGHRVIHLATHGFVLDSSCAPPPPRGTRAVGGVVAARPRSAAAAENPLLLAGLALAGANQRAAGSGEDGILTAEEVAGLNLQGTEWAVLSACDTGLGQVRAGEGVFGLRRAFQIAGVRTVIMSLWSVDDEATRGWMRALYDGRLNRGLDTAAAVRAASLRVLEARRARGQSTHPFYWAAFVASGDWR